MRISFSVQSSSLVQGTIIPAIRTPPPVQEASTLYANPICLQMDQTLLNADSAEAVLTVLVTHRGALFVHNLITALSSLAQMSESSVPFSVSRKFKVPDEREKLENDKLLADARYNLLVNDLIDNSPKLDIRSIEIILNSLRRLDHCHYRLFGSLLRRLYSLEICGEDLPVAISIGQTLEWGGFGKAETFFKRLSDRITLECENIDRKDLMNALLLFSKLSTAHVDVLNALSLTARRWIPSLSTSQLGMTCIAVSEYGESIPCGPGTIRLIAADVSKRRDTALRDLARVAVGLRRTNVEHPALITKAWSDTIDAIQEAQMVKERMDASVASISDVAAIVDACGHFGLCNSRDIAEVVVPYVMDHIDLVTEESAIKILFGMSSAPSSVTLKTAPTVSLLFRKIGSATDSWERFKLKIMSISFSKIMQYDFVDSDFRKFIIDHSLAHYLMARRGYGVPYPEAGEVLFRAVREALDNSGLSSVKMCFNGWVPNSPFNADLLFPDDRIAVVLLSRFSDQGNPVGVDLVQVNLIKALGWHVIPIHYKRGFQDVSHIIDTLPIARD